VTEDGCEHDLQAYEPLTVSRSARVGWAL